MRSLSSQENFSQFHRSLLSLYYIIYISARALRYVRRFENGEISASSETSGFLDVADTRDVSRRVKGNAMHICEHIFHVFAEGRILITLSNYTSPSLKYFKIILMHEAMRLDLICLRKTESAACRNDLLRDLLSPRRDG